MTDLDHAIVLDPDNAESFRQRGYVHALLGEYVETAADYAEATKLDPQDARSYFRCARAYQMLDQHAKALANFDRAIALRPSWAEAYVRRSDSYCRYGNVQQARADCEQAIRLNPNDPGAHFRLGLHRAESGDYGRAMEAFDVAHSAEPRWHMILVARAHARLEISDPKGALNDLLEARAIKPDLVVLPFLLARAYDGLGRHDEAQAERTKAAERNPEAAGLNALAEVFAAESRGDLARALLACDRLQTLDPRGAGSNVLRGLIHQERGDDRAAIAALDRALAMEPACFAARVLRAASRSSLNDVASALDDTDQAVQLRPADPVSYAGRGRVHSQAGDPARAVVDFTEALRLLSNRANAQEFRIWLTDATGERIRLCAKVSMSRPAAVDPTLGQSIAFADFLCSRANLYVERGWAYLRLRKLDKAVGDFAQALAHAPGSSQSAFLRGGLYAVRGEVVPAVVQLARAGAGIREEKGEGGEWH